MQGGRWGKELDPMLCGGDGKMGRDAGSVQDMDLVSAFIFTPDIIELA
jgi:hypothetical protein